MRTVADMPLPKASDWLRAFNGPTFSANRWIGSRPDSVAKVYHRGSAALAAAIKSTLDSSGASCGVVWIPDYFCNEALGFARSLPVKIRFYPVLENLFPNWSVFEDWLKQETGLQILVLVHYFGFPNDTQTAQNFCAQRGIVLIEDAAHVLLPSASIGLAGEAVIFSPRKILALPSGGLLVASGRIKDFVKDLGSAGANIVTARWAARRFAQKIFTDLRLPWHMLRNRNLALPRETFRETLPAFYNGGCGSYVLRLMGVLEATLDETLRIRRDNYTRLSRWLADCSFVRPLFSVLPPEVCPYVFPVLTDLDCDEVIKKTQSLGIPISRWPDLAPEVLAAPALHNVAIKIYGHLLTIPIHQSLGIGQIDAMGEQLRKIFFVERV